MHGRIQFLQSFDIAVAVAEGDRSENGILICEGCAAFRFLDGLYAMELLKQFNEALSFRRRAIGDGAAEKDNRFAFENIRLMRCEIFHIVFIAVAGAADLFFSSYAI